VSARLLRCSVVIIAPVLPDATAEYIGPVPILGVAICLAVHCIAQL